MEPEEKYEILEKFIKSRAWQYDDEILDAFAHKVATPSDKKEMLHPNSPNVNLAYVSTRELLNECYRRRAIEKFDWSVHVDKDMLEHEPAIRDYALRDLGQGLWNKFEKTEKFYNEAMSIREHLDHYSHKKIFNGEIYICKHPSKVKK